MPSWVSERSRGWRWLCRQCIEACRVGAKLRDVHHLSVRVLSEGLCQLGIFPGLDASSIAHNSYRMVYPHSVGELLAHAAAFWHDGYA